MFSAPWFRLFDMSFAPCPTMPSSHSAAPSFWCASLSQRLEPPRCIGGLWTGGPNQTGSGLLRGHSKPIRSRFVSQASQTGDLFVKQGPLVHKVVLWFVSLVVRVSRIKTLARRIRCSCVCVCVCMCVCVRVSVCVCVCVCQQLLSWQACMLRTFCKKVVWESNTEGKEESQKKKEVHTCALTCRFTESPSAMWLVLEQR